MSVVNPPSLAIQRHAYLLLVRGQIKAEDYVRAIVGSKR